MVVVAGGGRVVVRVAVGQHISTRKEGSRSTSRVGVGVGVAVGLADAELFGVGRCDGICRMACLSLLPTGSGGAVVATLGEAMVNFCQM